MSSQDYTVRGLLGKATEDFCEGGPLVEKTTFGESPEQVGGAAVAAPRQPPLVPRPGREAGSCSVTLRYTKLGLSGGFGHISLSSRNALYPTVPPPVTEVTGVNVTSPGKLLYTPDLG